MKPSDLRLKLTAGVYAGRPFVGVTATIRRVNRLSRPIWQLRIEDSNPDSPAILETARPTLSECLINLDAYGDKIVKTCNILNMAAGSLDIPLRDKGGCCDPGTERYHSM